MSKNINVNPDHYKVAGRERQGEDIVQQRHKTRYAKAQHELDERAQQRSESLQGMAERATAQGGEGEHFDREAARPPRSGGGAPRGETAGGRAPGRTTGTRSAAKKTAAKKRPTRKRGVPKKKAASKKKAATRSPAASKTRAGKTAAKRAPGRRKAASRSTSKRPTSAKRPARKK